MPRAPMDKRHQGNLAGWGISFAILFYLLGWLVVFRTYWPPEGVLQNVLLWTRFALGALAIIAFSPLSWRLPPFSTLSHRLGFMAAWLLSEVVTLALY